MGALSGSAPAFSGRRSHEVLRPTLAHLYSRVQEPAGWTSESDRQGDAAEAEVHHLYIAAIHEAGHAVVAYRLGITPNRATVSSHAGRVTHMAVPLTVAIPTIAAAGRAAERVFGIETGHGFALDRATVRRSAAVLARRGGRGTATDYVTAAVAAASLICRTNRDAIAAIADRLVEAESLSGDDLATALESACRR